MSDKRRVEMAIYLAFFALIMCAPLLLDPFWLNRIAKYLVFGMLGVAVALSWGYAGILNLGQGLFFGARRLHAGDVAEARQPDQPAAGLGQAGAGLHAVERRAGRADRIVLHQQGVVPVASVPVPVVRRRHGAGAAGGARHDASEPSCFASASRACSCRSSRWRWCCWCGSWSSTPSPSPTASTG